MRDYELIAKAIVWHYETFGYVNISEDGALYDEDDLESLIKEYKEYIDKEGTK